MKKITLLLLLTFSQIVLSNPKITETEKLTATCKIWGFLKYYHPKVAKGDFNWDQQLLDVLPKIEQAQTKEEFSLIMTNWIDSLGEVPVIAPIIPQKGVEYFDKNFDLSWINSNKLFSKNLSKKLRFIEQNRFQTDEEIGPDFRPFKNGNYFDLTFDNKQSRIVTLFMYWNLIEYFFSYKYVMDQKWDITLEKTIPLVLDAKNEDDFYTAMRKAASKLNDSHVEFYIYKYSKFDEDRKYFPADCKIMDNKMVVTKILADSLAQSDDIKVGDVITKINDKTIKDLIAEYRDLFTASNEPSLLDKLIKKFLISNSDNVNVEFLKDGKYTTKAMTWYDYHDSHRNEFKRGPKKKKKEKFKVLDNNIGYVDMGILKIENVPDMIESLKATKAIVFDLRNYPRGTYDDIAKFLNAHEEKFAIYTYPDFSYPGRFKWTEGSSGGTENKDNYKGKVIVLLNEESLSQSEWTAMCFQTAGNTTIIGSQTAGADGNVIELDLKQFHTRYTGIGVYYPDKRETQRIGIVPDIEVKPTIKGIQEGRDEVLERALLFIESGK
ncbi:C-terminal processing protease CtpA/Prc [Flavobacterium sp. 270]|uniref:S41 family peptidase n=1 Tax=Flavobacterium sp. 270 TaxID=2512114 RepID=UPI001064E558|nr:S41 family peptidase [Flavobacterium sp. 270]TDW49964.1 C-terminal processing protease CtpA/Prc [Flavobacterium sp. 270]